ncbi:MAG TPA: hypothetical protein PL131_07710 [Methylotenera sp.]|nr:hypothetical protein [Methylotenera sp.]HPN02187.1 hypothetical protein [Methylotenera sp.]
MQLFVLDKNIQRSFHAKVQFKKIFIAHSYKFRTDIDVLRTALWFDCLKSHLNVISAYGVRNSVVPKHINENQYNPFQEIKWAKYQTGKHTPTKRVAELAESVVPNSRVILDHVLWRILKAPTPTPQMIKSYLSQLNSDVKGVLYTNQMGRLRRKKVDSQLYKALERVSSLDALAALILLLREGEENKFKFRSLIHSIYNTCLIVFSIELYSKYNDYIYSIFYDRVFSRLDDEIYDLKNWDNQFAEKLIMLNSLCEKLANKVGFDESQPKPRSKYLQKLLDGDYGLPIADALAPNWV